jgi:hypothetical protein
LIFYCKLKHSTHIHTICKCGRKSALLRKQYFQKTNNKSHVDPRNFEIIGFPGDFVLFLDICLKSLNLW